ncbi:MAG: HAMP domain-containing histidine kinase [Deltaproteobacteria bacterium]|nr:HAMP domain-containing histidine kinase [Deltaproteobacteria bacterium]
MRPDRDHRLDLWWLSRLRWLAFAMQLTSTVVAGPVFRMEVPVAELLPVVFLGGASNVALHLWARRATRVAERALTGVLALDVGLLTILLSLTGGADNPFSFLYFVHVALASVLLGTLGTWMISVFTLVSFGTLFFVERTMGDTILARDGGKWLAFALATLVVTYFADRVRRALAGREDELEAVRAEKARDEKLASLATLAAGAAHELATPLGTIAIAAKEIERAAVGAALSDDARLIREEVARCRVILDQMAAKAGESTGEVHEIRPLEEILARALDGVPDRALVRVTFDEASRATRLRLPVKAFAQALRVLVTNARDASSPQSSIELRATRDNARLRLEVIDSGLGMSPDVLRRAGEPFFTTKEPGRGTGLGLFLARSVIERLGGRLELSSTAGKGTTAMISIPIEPDEPSHDLRSPWIRATRDE